MAARQHHQWLEDEMFKIADCKTAGLGKPDHVEGETVQETIDRLYLGDSPDWVITQYDHLDRKWRDWRVPEKRDWKIACKTRDIHENKYGFNQKFVDIRNKSGYDALLMKCVKLRWDGDLNIMRKKLDADIHLLWYHFPIDLVNKILAKAEKTFDVNMLCAASYGPYPLRFNMMKRLPKMIEKYGWNIQSNLWPPGQGRRFIPELEKNFMVGEDYCQAVADSRILLFSSSRFGYSVQKYAEGGFFKTLMLADSPTEAKENFLIPDWNFVEINKNNWTQKLLYYLKHENERLEIVENAYETMMKYHTSEIRARELLDFFEANR